MMVVLKYTYIAIVTMSGLWALDYLANLTTPISIFKFLPYFSILFKCTDFPTIKQIFLYVGHSWVPSSNQKKACKLTYRYYYSQYCCENIHVTIDRKLDHNDRYGNEGHKCSHK